MFAWKPVDNRRLAKRHAAERAEMYRREIGERAALLHRLGFTAPRAKSRIKAEVAWDFELHGSPKHASEVDKIVDQIWKRGGATLSV